MPISPDPKFANAVAALKRGELVAMPTETVYGLAADARNPEAVRKIFALKGRPADHPLIVHLSSASQIDDWAADIPQAARSLAEAFWPGPLTLVLKRAASADTIVTGGQDTIGLRVPRHPIAHALLEAFGGGVAAPSANRFGHISPTRAAHVRDEFPTGIAVILDGGDSDVGLESTIVDLSGEQARLLRPGAISQAQLEAVVGPVQVAVRDDEGPRASGRLASHYAPRTPTYLVPRERLRSDAAVLALDDLPAGMSGIALPRDAAAYAQALYASLRALDQMGRSRIQIETPPNAPEWLAIHDRLRRAAARDGDAQG